MGWLVEDGLAVKVMRIAGKSPTPPTITEANAIYTQESQQNGGVLMELESVKTPAGMVLRSVFKCPMPNQPLGTMVVGIGLLAWPEVHVRVHVEAVELGTTGLREAGVMLLDPSAVTNATTTEPIHVHSGDELFKRMAQSRKQMKPHPGDDPKWDEKFPAHPLSRVRRCQGQVLASLRVDGMPMCG